jgi:hypothetical protein
MVPFLT